MEPAGEILIASRQSSIDEMRSEASVTLKLKRLAHSRQPKLLTSLRAIEAPRFNSTISSALSNGSGSLLSNLPVFCPHPHLKETEKFIIISEDENYPKSIPLNLKDQSNESKISEALILRSQNSIFDELCLIGQLPVFEAKIRKSDRYAAKTVLSPSTKSSQIASTTATISEEPSPQYSGCMANLPSVLSLKPSRFTKVIESSTFKILPETGKDTEDASVTKGKESINCCQQLSKGEKCLLDSSLLSPLQQNSSKSKPTESELKTLLKSNLPTPITMSMTNFRKIQNLDKPDSPQSILLREERRLYSSANAREQPMAGIANIPSPSRSASSKRVTFSANILYFHYADRR